MEQTYSLAIDGNDNIIVGGGTFGSFPGFTNFGQVDAFIRKYDSSGYELFTRQFGSSTIAYVYSIAVDSSNSIIVGGTACGAFPGFTNAGSGSSGNCGDAFIRKYDESGNELFTRQYMDHLRKMKFTA